MVKLLKKEIKLSASCLSFIFIAAAFLTFVPGYPILLGAFFTTLGIFYSFQSMRENNDIYYSFLLPVSKADTVKGKYMFVLLIEGISFFIMCVITIIRMALFDTAKVYVSNKLMCANLIFLGFALLIFALFNYCFVAGFFKTAYSFAKPFITYCVFSLLLITVAESLHFMPPFYAVNTLGFENLLLQTVFFCLSLAVFIIFTLFSLKKSVIRFEKTDL